MAAKHDGKRASANMWVTHQNLARAKGGRPQYQPPVKKGKKAAPAPAEPVSDEKTEKAEKAAKAEKAEQSGKTADETPKPRE